MKMIPVLLALSLMVPAFAQEGGKFFRLDLVVKELDDNKVVNAKSYSTVVSTDEKISGANIRMSNKVPYQTAGLASGFQYADVGVNIDCKKATELNSQLVLMLAAEVSSLQDGASGSTPNAPVIRQNRWNATVIVPVGKATTLFSSDDLNSKRKMQLELTATLVK